MCHRKQLSAVDHTTNFESCAWNDANVFIFIMLPPRDKDCKIRQPFVREIDQQNMN